MDVETRYENEKVEYSKKSCKWNKFRCNKLKTKHKSLNYNVDLIKIGSLLHSEILISHDYQNFKALERNGFNQIVKIQK